MTVNPTKKPTKGLLTPRKMNTFSNSPARKDQSVSFENIGGFELDARGLMSNSEDVTMFLNLPKRYPFSGETKFTGSFTLGLVSKCEGRLVSCCCRWA